MPEKYSIFGTMNEVRKYIIVTSIDIKVNFEIIEDSIACDVVMGRIVECHSTKYPVGHIIIFNNIVIRFFPDSNDPFSIIIARVISDIVIAATIEPNQSRAVLDGNIGASFEMDLQETNSRDGRVGAIVQDYVIGSGEICTGDIRAVNKQTIQTPVDTVCPVKHNGLVRHQDGINIDGASRQGIIRYGNV